MGELKVHRVRFFDYMPSAIRAMAFNPRTERLAVAREDGALELFNFSDHYFQEKVRQHPVQHLYVTGRRELTSGPQVIPGRKGRATDALCWVGERLFSAGLNGEITEYDLDSLRPRSSTSAYGGPIWTLSSNPQGTLLAVSGEPAASPPRPHLS